MIKFLKKSGTMAISIISIIFVFVPENVFKLYKISSKLSENTSIIVNRLFVFVAVWLLSFGFILFWSLFKSQVTLKGKNYTIKVKYGDIFKQNKCSKVIPFDECFSVKVGSEPGDINSSSICGQYLSKNPIDDMDDLLTKAGLKSVGKSKYRSLPRYDSGKLVVREEYCCAPFSLTHKKSYCLSQN